MQLRPYQNLQKQNIYKAWDEGASNVLAVLPTGGGKTVIFSEIIKDHDGASCTIAHRQEIVCQISLAMARDGVRHRIIGPRSVIRQVVNNHMDELGQSFYSPQSHCAVAGVDTLVRRKSDLAQWLKSVTLWVQDEAHHVLRGNKWGSAAAMFANAKGLGVTATPLRADGKGLGRQYDGLFDQLVVGPTMRDLINTGYLTDYKIYAPQSDFKTTGIPTGKDGDYTRPGMMSAVKKSCIIGDVVKHYQRIASGKLGITFATDVESATDIAKQFNLAGVPAEVVTAKTLDKDRISILQRFKNKKLLQLVNVDLFGEGFDLPAIEVVSMVRPTRSFALYCQQFGRSLRLMIPTSKLSTAWGSYTDAQRRDKIAASDKPYAIIIDHVGNIQTDRGGLGLPDAPRIWSLASRDRRSKSNNDVIPHRACAECGALYERIYKACPFCHYMHVPMGRSKPEFVDGDLIELDAATLAHMRGQIDRVDLHPEDYRAVLQNEHVPLIGQLGHVKRHVKRQQMQKELRASICWWGAYQRANGLSDSESYRLFYLRFEIDVMSAQTLNAKDAHILMDKINKTLGDLAA